MASAPSSAPSTPRKLLGDLTNSATRWLSPSKSTRAPSSPKDTPRKHKTPSAALRQLETARTAPASAILNTENAISRDISHKAALSQGPSENYKGSRYLEEVPFTLEEAREYCIEKLGKTPSDFQLLQAYNAVRGFDTFTLAKTGEGKSLIFQLLVLLAFHPKWATLPPTRSRPSLQILLVICPLITLAHDQVKANKKVGIESVSIDATGIDRSILIKQVLEGKYKIVYVSPETLFYFGSFLKDLGERSKKSNFILGALIDEAHLTDQWSKEFRKDYGRLADLRSILGFHVPVHACSATITNITFHSVYKLLGYGARPLSYWDNGCDRTNIVQSVKPMLHPKNSFIDLLVILNTLLSKIPLDEIVPSSLPKSLIFVESKQAAEQAMIRLCQYLPQNSHDAVSPFHAGLSDTTRARRFEDFSRSGGRVRWLISTEAAGAGCDVADIEYVVVYGMPQGGYKSLMQRFGRGWRSRAEFKYGVALFIGEKYLFKPETLERYAGNKPKRKPAQQLSSQMQMVRKQRAGRISKDQAVQSMSQQLQDDEDDEICPPTDIAQSATSRTSKGAAAKSAESSTKESDETLRLRSNADQDLVDYCNLPSHGCRHLFSREKLRPDHNLDPGKSFHPVLIHVEPYPSPIEDPSECCDLHKQALGDSLAGPLLENVHHRFVQLFGEPAEPRTVTAMTKIQPVHLVEWDRDPTKSFSERQFAKRLQDLRWSIYTDHPTLGGCQSIFTDQMLLRIRQWFRSWVSTAPVFIDDLNSGPKGREFVSRPLHQL